MDPIYYPFLFAGLVILAIILVLLWESRDQDDRAKLAQRDEEAKRQRVTPGWYDPAEHDRFLEAWKGRRTLPKGK